MRSRRNDSSRYRSPRPARSSTRSRWATSPASSATHAATCSGRVSASCSPKATRNCRTTSLSFPIGLRATPSRNACCPACSSGEAVTGLLAFARAGIEYPAGRLGELELEQELQRLDHFRARARAACSRNRPLEPVSTTLEFTLDGEPWRLTGDFGDLRKSGLVRYRYDDARASDYLDGWLEHLFLNAMAAARGRAANDVALARRPLHSAPRRGRAAPARGAAPALPRRAAPSAALLSEIRVDLHDRRQEPVQGR